MKRIICIALSLIFCTSCSMFADKPVLKQCSPVPLSVKLKDKQSEVQGYTPLNFDEQKAVWISYIDLQGMIYERSEAEFKRNISAAFDKVLSLGCNTVYVHARSFGDAYYKSELYPFTKAVTGKIGGAMEYDPLEIMIDSAHDKGLSFHAWINPMRCEALDYMEEIPDEYPIKRWFSDREKYAGYLAEVDGHYWLNPGFEEVRELIADGVCEIVDNYDVDGIHIDDYFYPTTDESFDSEVYAEVGNGQKLSDWRCANVDKMVQGIYQAVKEVDSRVLFGVSPQGNMENNYAYMYADVKKWCSEEGYLDYIVPQVYFGFDNSLMPFESTVDEWSSIIKRDDVRLVIGLGVYKIGQEDEFLQSTGIIGEQIDVCKKNDKYGGVALYNYINLFEPDEELAERTNAELLCIKEAIDE